MRGARDSEENRTTDEKVVNNFGKARNGTNQILESVDELRTVYPDAVCPYFSVRLTSRTYEIFMNRSGLSDGHSAMLIPAVGRIVPGGL